jgi:biopolymer transport protein ExbD
MKGKLHRRESMVEINITPFTDIVLVLLIIFMIATPILMQDSLRVNLPRASQAVQSDVPKNIVVTIDERGDAFFEKTKYVMPDHFNELTTSLGNRTRSNRMSSVIIKADKNCKYDNVVRVINIINQAGIKKVLLGIELRKQESVL